MARCTLEYRCYAIRCDFGLKPREHPLMASGAETHDLGTIIITLQEFRRIVAEKECVGEWAQSMTELTDCRILDLEDVDLAGGLYGRASRFLKGNRLAARRLQVLDGR
jgi:hypothetical protein